MEYKGIPEPKLKKKKIPNWMIAKVPPSYKYLFVLSQGESLI